MIPTYYFLILSAILFAIGVCGSVVVSLAATLRQRATPDALLGRVAGASDMLYDAMLPLGLLSSGALMKAADGVVALVGIGALMIANAATFAFSPGMRRAA